MTSRVSGPIENPSAAMWCTTSTSTCSVSDTRSRRTRTGTSVVTSNPAETISATVGTISDSLTADGVSAGFTSEVGSTCW